MYDNSSAIATAAREVCKTSVNLNFFFACRYKVYGKITNAIGIFCEEQNNS